MKTHLVAVLLSTLLMQAGATAAEDSMPMQQHMQEMQTLMAAIKAEQDPAKREALMMEHMESMKEDMTMMSHGAPADTANMTMEQRMENMEQDMEMMHKMMGQMMQHEEGEADASAEHQHEE